MGEISGKLADITVVTAVDPRGQLEKINEQIIEGIEKAGKRKGEDYYVVFKVEDKEEEASVSIDAMRQS